MHAYEFYFSSKDIAPRTNNHSYDLIDSSLPGMPIEISRELEFSLSAPESRI